MALAGALGTAAQLGARNMLTDPEFFDTALAATGVFLTFAVIFMAYVCWDSWRPSNPPGLRRRAATFGVASVIAFLVPSVRILFQSQAELVFDGSVFINWVFLAAFPVLIGYSIVRHQMFDLRVVLRQGIVYGGLSLSLSLIYASIVYYVAKKLQASPSPVVMGFTMAGVIVAFGIVQVRLQRVVDRAVYRSRYVYADAIKRASDALAHARDLAGVAATVKTAMISAMQLSRAYVAVRESSANTTFNCLMVEDDLRRVPRMTTALLPENLDANDFLPIRRLVMTAELVSTHDIQSVAAQSTMLSDTTRNPYFGRCEATFWPHYGIEAIVPLCVARDASGADEAAQREVVGMLLLGPKRNGRQLDSEDYSLLATLANQLAIAIENANAFEEIRQLKDGLEQKVTERTEELSQALGQLKEAQAQLIESAKQAMLGQVVAGLVHEVNSPLGTLQSSADTIRRALIRCEPALINTKDRGSRKTDPVRALQSAQKLSEVVEESGRRISSVLDSLKRFVSLDEAQLKTV